VVSPGCTNCYAMRMAHRLATNSATSWYAGTTARKAGGPPVWTGKVALAPERTLLAPMRRRKPTTWFVNSMGDLFHEAIPDEWIDRVFAVMALCPQHRFQVLTKRPERMRSYLSTWPMASDHPDRITAYAADLAYEIRGRAGDAGVCERPLPHVWLGVSVEDQRRADERIPILLQTPASVRFISAEPLLEALTLNDILAPKDGALLKMFGPDGPVDVLRGDPRLDWVIVGGESGPGHRSMDPDWARSIRDQCDEAGVAFWFKQMAGGETIPDDLMVREMPCPDGGAAP